MFVERDERCLVDGQMSETSVFKSRVNTLTTF
jgi:hypothetical protein